jgi:Ca2+-dependent lipid-binding protein
VGARIPALNQSGGSWDAFSGLPDPYLKATSGAAAGATAYISDTLTPVWNTVVLGGLSANALKADLTIEASDSDSVFDDLIGGCPVPLSGTEFDGALHTVTCPATATGVMFSVDYRLKAR